MILRLIPSRCQSTRLPEKALTYIENLPLIVHTYKSVKKSLGPDDLIVCADDKKIIDVINKQGGKSIMTSINHVNGTYRVAEIASKYKVRLVIDIQCKN